MRCLTPLAAQHREPTARYHSHSSTLSGDPKTTIDVQRLRLIPWYKIFWTPTSWSADMRRSAAQSLHVHSFNETQWHQLVFASWADASDRPRPDGSRTGGFVVTLATEEQFGHGQEDDVSVMAWRSFKLPRKIAGSDNGETRALAFADESLWLVRCFDAALAFGRNGPTSGRYASSQIPRGIFDALTRSESPQLRLRSSRTGEEARGIKEQCAVSIACIHSPGQHFDDVGRLFDQAWVSRSCGDGIVRGQETMEVYLRSYV